jgi:hypothetical protein
MLVITQLGVTLEVQDSLGDVFIHIKLSGYMPWRQMGGEEV